MLMYIDGMKKTEILSPKIKSKNMTIEKDICIGDSCLGGFPFKG